MNDAGPPQGGRLWRLGRFLEDLVLVVLLAGMILLAGAQIVLRNVFDSGLGWADPLLRILVLWIALAGALAASRDRNHIRIDVLSRFLAPRPRVLMRTLTSLFTAAACGVVAWHALVFVRGSAEFGDTVLGDLPAWWFQAILPAGFFLIGWRYLVHAFNDAVAFWRGDSAS